MDRTTLENPDRDLLTSEQIESLTIPLARHEYQALCEDAVNAVMFNYDGYLKLLEHDAALRAKLAQAEQENKTLIEKAFRAGHFAWPTPQEPNLKAAFRRFCVENNVEQPNE